MFKPNTFFHFPKNCREFLNECMTIADVVWCDQLDCKKSFTRQPTDKTPSEVLDIGLNNNSHYTFIYRAGYSVPDYFETGLSTLNTNPAYFLWINLNLENGQKIVEKYNLQIKNF